MKTPPSQGGGVILRETGAERMGRIRIRQMILGDSSGRRRKRWGLCVTPRRLAAVVVALSLWMACGGLPGSLPDPPPQPDRGAFGEMHWYGGW